MKELKRTIYEQCVEVVEQRIKETNIGIAEIRSAAQDGSKSSVGDKYETGMAMAHLEVDKLKLALHNLSQMKVVLSQINPAKEQDQIEHGALVQTEQELIYIAVGLGKLVLNEQDVLVVSFQAPVIQALKLAGNEKTATFNGRNYTIEAIC